MKRYTMTFQKEAMDFYKLKVVSFTDNAHKNSTMRSVEISVVSWVLEPTFNASFLQRLCSYEDKKNPQKCICREVEIMQDMLNYARTCDEAYQYDFRHWWKRNGFESRYSELTTK